MKTDKNKRKRYLDEFHVGKENVSNMIEKTCIYCKCGMDETDLGYVCSSCLALMALSELEAKDD